MGRQQSRAIDTRRSRPRRRRTRQAVLGCAIAAAGLAGAASSAAAQVYTPVAVVPNPDVYAYFQQNAGVQSLFGPQVTGQFTGLTVFGDSYADWGNAKRAQGGVGTSTGRFSAGLSMGDAFQYHYGLATSSVANYAVGGAQSGETNVAGPTLPGTGSEIRTFLANGGRFGARDLVNITTAGGNDGVPILFNPFITQAQMNAAAAQTNANIVGGVQQLVNAGARNISILSVGDLSYLPIASGNANIHYFQTTLTQMEQASLSPLARAGVRIFFFDLGTLTQRIVANPPQYGFSNVTQACTSVPSCVGGSVATQNSYLSYDGLHFTTAGFALIGRYQTNQIDAPLTVAPQGDIAMSIASGFMDSVFGRLDSYRVFSPYGIGSAMNAMAADMPVKAARLSPVAPNPWSVYGNVTYGGGSRDQQFGQSGLSYNAVGGQIGIDYRLSPDWVVGGLFGYAQPNVKLGIQDAREKIDAYQFAGYASYTSRNWFADGLFAYGRQTIATERQGVIDIIRGSTAADTFTVAARGGYLWDIGPLRAGPLAGLSYTHAQIAAYTESGDALLTNTVDQQKLESLVGSLGVQLRAPLAMADAIYSPYVNVTAEHDFIGSARTLITTQLSTPLLPVLTPIDARSRTYGKVAAGIAAAVSSNVSANLNVVSSFARSDSNDYGVSGGLKVAF